MILTTGNRTRLDLGPGSATGRHGPVRITLGFQIEPDAVPQGSLCPICTAPKPPARMTCSVWCRQQFWARQPAVRG